MRVDFVLTLVLVTCASLVFARVIAFVAFGVSRMSAPIEDGIAIVGFCAAAMALVREGRSDV